MPDPISITALLAVLATNTPIWFSALQGTLLNSGGDLALQKGINVVRNKLHMDEKEQQRHLKAALQRAVEVGQNRFHTPAEQAQYRAIIAYLSTSGVPNNTFRSEALRLFTLSETPQLAKLNELYNRSLPISISNQLTPTTEVDAAPYLMVFFSALVEALYADPIFKPQISDILHLRAMQNMQNSLVEVSSTLRQMHGTLADHYTIEQFEHDKETYIEHIQNTLRTLKLVGVVPKGRGSERPDPELGTIFVPLRLKAEDTKMSDDRLVSIIGWLEKYPYLVLLGGPGSGKSTALRYLAWSHAVTHCEPSLISSTSIPLLSDRPFPLRIELRRLSEERHQQQPNLDFLDYVVRVLLGRAGQHIKRQMFIELLTQKRMLCLFDGLDEVATLDERRLLIDEIEAFVQRYPGNRVLVTSRSVGYDLARLNTQLFMHTTAQEFDDQQIGTFLDHWYTHVLQLSPLPPEDSQELETLYTTLKENPRLHALATNPLLLTVITALHRYERLPDRRILVYNRCAELLLDTWAKLKGTDVRWKEMKMGKEDQYACVAHLGFILHERSQEKREESSDSDDAPSTTDIASDVPTRFILKEIEKFLKGRRLLSENAEQRTEADRFLKLTQIEAGLIVERGQGEHGEELYGFVHRTFQEYFAAADVHEHYQQEEDAGIISHFLHEHLYDPHWHETILLLLAMLKRRPATTQLRQILTRKSRLGEHVDILHQDLFFVCTCLAEDIAVDIELAASVISRISMIVSQSPFPSQRKKALDALASLLRTRQYAQPSREALRTFATQDVLKDPIAKAHAVKLFCDNSPKTSPEQQKATQILAEVMQRSDLTIKQSIMAAKALYRNSSYGSYERRQATKKLAEVAQRTDLTIDQSIKAAQELYYCSTSESPEEQITIQKLTETFQRSDLTVDQTIQVAKVLSWRLSADDLKEQLIVTQKLIEILQRTDLTVDQTIQVADILLDCNIISSPEQRVAMQKLLDVLQCPDLAVDQTIKAIRMICNNNLFKASEQQQALQKLLTILQNPALTIEQLIHAIRNLIWIDPSEFPNWQMLVLQHLTAILHHKEITIEQAIETAGMLYENSFPTSQEEQFAKQIIVELLQRNDLTIEQVINSTKTLYRYNLSSTQEGQLATQTLVTLLQKNDLTNEQTIAGAGALYRCSSYQAPEQIQALQSLVDFLHHQPFNTIMHIAQETRVWFQDYWKSPQHHQTTQKLTEIIRQKQLSDEQKIEAIVALYAQLRSKERKKIFLMITELLEQTNISVEHKLDLIQGYYNGRSFSSTEIRQINNKLLEILLLPDLNREQFTAMSRLFSRSRQLFKFFDRNNTFIKNLKNLMRQTTFSVGQQLQIANALYICGSPDSSDRQLATTKLVELAERTDLSIEQSIFIAQTLYQRLPAKSAEEQLATAKLVELAGRTDLSIEQSISIAQILYKSSPNKSLDEQLATQTLVTLLELPDLLPEQRIQAAQALYHSSHFQSPQRFKAVQELQQQVQNQELSLDQRIQLVIVPLTETDTNYADRVQAINKICALTNRQTAIHHIKKQWVGVNNDNIVPSIDIPCLVDLVNDERLPIEVRDEIYEELERLIPEFENSVDED